MRSAQPTARIDASTVAILKLAWPVVVTRSTQAVVGLADALMVARLGSTALAASTTGALNTFLLLIFPMGISFIVSSYASQLSGGNDRQGARRYGFYGLGLALVTELLCLIGLPFIRPGLEATGSFEPEVLDLIAVYMSYRIAAGGAAVGFEALSNYYGGLGNTKLPMRISVFVMAANIGLNAIFIFGLLGVPALGIAGAALGSALSVAVGFGALLTNFLLDARAEEGRIPRLSLAEWARMIRFGFPAGLNWFFEFFAFIFFVDVIVANYGTLTLAAFMTALELNSVSFMPAFGIASAGAIVVGQQIGAEDHASVPSTVWRTFKLSAAWQGIVACLYLIFPTVIFSVFVRESQADYEVLLSLGSFVVMYSASWQLCDAAATTLAEALRAAGDTDFTMWTRLALGWLFFAPGSYLTIKLWGAPLGWAVLWLVLYLGLLAVILWIRFQSGAWRSIELVETSVAR